MKLLLDMNLTPRWIEFLQAAKFQALHWSQIGQADASDTEIMKYAAAHDFIVLTHDLDFSAILAATQGKKPSVIQIRARNIAPEAVGKTVVSALYYSRVELGQERCSPLRRIARGFASFRSSSILDAKEKGAEPTPPLSNPLLPKLPLLPLPHQLTFSATAFACKNSNK